MAATIGPCEHKQLLRCELTAVAVCCMCADSRPLSQAYPTYVDGSGMRNEGTRWQKYCWRCRDHWKAQDQHERSSTISTTDEEPSWSFPPQTALSPQLSPFAGTQRRNGRSQRSTLHNPLYAPDSSETNRHHEAMPGPSTQRRASRRNNNVADHISPLPEGTDPLSEARRRPPQNPFGTREEWEAPDYQSPLAGMFTRAWTRYRDAEAARRREEFEIQDQMQRLRLELENPPPPSFPGEHTQRSMPNNPIFLGTSTLTEQVARVHGAAEQLQQRAYARADAQGDIDINFNYGPSSRPLYPFPSTDRGYTEVDRSVWDHDSPLGSSPPPPRNNPIDAQPTRPEPLNTDDMNVNIACKICCEQKMDTILLPCYHLNMCRWCAAIMRSNAAASRDWRRNRLGLIEPRVRGEGWNCPICRRGVEGTRRIFLG
jgi:hypothetical protein